SEKDISKMNPEDLPDVTAFQDDFTREFMTSTEEVEDGYYLFESKTGGYTMWYPEDAIMNKGYYERTKDTFERVSFGVEANKDKDSLLYLLSSTVDYKGDYDKFEHQDNSIFFATSESTTRSKKTTWYEFFGLIKSKNTNQSLRYIYSVKCEGKTKNCSYDLESIEQKVKDIMKSVKFKDVELEEG